MTALDRLPLRQTVTPTGAAEVAFAAQGLLDDLSKPGRYRIVRHGAGGQILAADEPALAQARQLLRDVYGALVDFGDPLLHAPEPSSLSSLDSPS